jgi:hypothetical protein
MSSLSLWKLRQFAFFSSKLSSPSRILF